MAEYTKIQLQDLSSGKEFFPQTYADCVLDLQSWLDNNKYLNESSDFLGKYVTNQNLTDALQNYYLKTDTYSKNEIDAFKFATQSWVEDKNYLTSANLNGYATSEDVTSAIAALEKKIMTGDAEGEVAQAYDTLKEIADWIASHGTEASNLTGRVSALETSVTSLGTSKLDVSVYETDKATFATITWVESLYGSGEDKVLYTKEEVDAIKNGFETRIAALETKTQKLSNVYAATV